jgi:cytochrome c biogenesis protein CcdA
VLAILILGGMLSGPRTSIFLQEHGVQLLGPLLILVAMVLLEMIRLPRPRAAAGPAMQRRVDAWGLWSALPLGIVLALAFCPVSAACFFASLLAMLASGASWVLLPLAYGLGTALPVIVFAVLIALSVGTAGRMFDRLRQVQIWARRAAGVILIVMGIHYCLKYDFAIVPFWDRWW